MSFRTYVVMERKQRGIALIEALIAIFLFSLGVLALVGLQAVMSKNVTQAKLRGEASFLANQLIGQMWVDQPNLSSYRIADGECTTTGYAKCTNWRTAVKQTLPGGVANVTVDGSAVDITLNWELPGDGAAPSQYQISANVVN